MRQQQQRAQLESIYLEHAERKSRLEAKREELRLCAKGLQEREYFNESEERKLDHLKKMVLKYVLYLIFSSSCCKIYSCYCYFDGELTSR